MSLHINHFNLFATNSSFSLVSRSSCLFMTHKIWKTDKKIHIKTLSSICDLLFCQGCNERPTYLSKSFDYSNKQPYLLLNQGIAIMHQYQRIIRIILLNISKVFIRLFKLQAIPGLHFVKWVYIPLSSKYAVHIHGIRIR